MASSFFAHLFKDAGELIDEFLFFFVKDHLFFDRLLESADSKIEDAAAGITLAKITEGLGPFVRIRLSLLELFDRLGDFTELKVKLA